MQTKLTTFIAIAVIFFGCKTTFNLGQCEQLFLDFEKGTVNGVSASASMDKVKNAFPCSTGETEEGSDFNCGGGVYFLKHGFYFYTHRDFIEVRKDYTGKMSKPVLGLKRAAFFDLLGNPDVTLEHTDEFFGETTYVHQYPKKWGTLAFVEEGGEIKQIELHQGKKIGEVEYCF